MHYARAIIATMQLKCYFPFSLYNQAISVDVQEVLILIVDFILSFGGDLLDDSKLFPLEVFR